MKLKYWVLLTVLILGLTYIISNAIVTSYENPANSDFFSFWLAGRMVNSGEDPYSATAWEDGHQRYNSTWLSDPEFLYPLPLAFLFVPLSFLLVEQAFIIWVWITQMMLLVALMILLQYFGTQKKHYILPLILGLILFRPILPLLKNGQLSALILIIVVSTITLWKNKYWFWGGVLISLLLLKPNIGLPYLGLITVYLLLQKKWTAISGILASAFGLFFIGMLVNPHWLVDYGSILVNKQSLTFGYTPTIWGLVAFLVRFDMGKAIIVGGIVSIFFISIFIYSIAKEESLAPICVFSICTPIALLSTAYLWPYDQLLLVIPIVACMVLLKTLHFPYLSGPLTFIAIDIVGYTLFGISINLQMENLNAILSLVVLGTLGVLIWLSKRQTEPLSVFVG